MYDLFGRRAKKAPIQLDSSIQLLEAEMSDKPREWPNNARTYRDDALDEAIAAVRCLIPLIDLVNDPDGLRRLIEVNRHLDRIKELMREAGAPYRP
jgi:hypothetical protein